MVYASLKPITTIQSSQEQAISKRLKLGVATLLSQNCGKEAWIVDNVIWLDNQKPLMSL